MARPPEPDGSRPTPTRRSESDGPVRMPHAPRPRGLRAALAPDRLLAAARTLAWLAPLTVLIWIYAEREQEVPISAGRVPLTVRSALPTRVVEFTGSNQQPTVDLKLYGPREATDRVKSQLYLQPGLVLDVASPPGQGLPINVIEAIQNLPLFKSAGVSVLEADKPEVLVNVDNVVDADAVVEADPNLTILTATAFDPPRVRVRGPARQIESLRSPDGSLHVTADLSKVTNLTVPGEHSAAVSVAMGGPLGEVRVVPPQVKATVQVRAADEPYTLRAINICPRASSPEVWNDYTVQLLPNGDSSIGPLQVTGPPEQIAALRAHPVPAPTADLEIAAEDYGQDKEKRLTYNLPPGVHVSPEQANRAYGFKLTRRDPNGG